VRIAIPIAVVLFAGCGSGVDRELVVDRGRSATPPYDGPLDTSAAVAALECDGKTPYQRGEGVYDDGLATVQASAEAALDDYMRESGLSFSTPSDGYAVEREQDGRVLFSYDVDGRTKVSMFAADSVRDWNGITFLLVGPEKSADWYVRDTSGGDFSELLRTTFADEATLPEGATDTGLRRDGRQLWIGPDQEAAYLVSVDDAQDVERWPAAKQPIRCA
jgi:hypothetical protein